MATASDSWIDTLLFNLLHHILITKASVVLGSLLKEIGTVTQVQILDKAVCISLSANTPRKDMHLFIFPLAICEYESRLGFLPLVWGPV